MPDNDFEKQVHQKMGELRLLPSETVWKQVDMRLHRKENRRRWLIWLPFLLAGIALGGYFAFTLNHSPHFKQLQATTETASKDKKTKNNIPRSTEKSGTLNRDELTIPVSKGSVKTPIKNTFVITKKDKTSNAMGKIEAVKFRYNPKAKIKTSVTGSSDTNQPSLRKSKKSPGKISHRVESDYLAAISQKGKSDPPVPHEKISVAISSAELVPKSDINDDKQMVPVKINIAENLAGSISTTLIPVKENQRTITVNKRQHLNKGWQWGLSFQGGRSSLTSGVLNKLFSSSADALSFSSANQSSTGNTSINGVYLQPYPTRASAGFSAGVFLKKNLSGTFAVSLGVNYTLYTTSNTIGKGVDSLFQSSISGNIQMFNRYYRIGNSGSYTNKYHYIEMPLTLQTRLTRNWKLPLYWDLGFSLSKLVASNALHFDNTTRYYYKDNALLNKKQFNVTTSFAVKLSSKKNFELQAGPEIHYGFNRVEAKVTSPGTHFLFFGLKAHIVIGKK